MRVRPQVPGGIQRRLLLLLLLPLLGLALLNTWFDYRLADSAAIQQDRQLLTLVPQLADAVQHGPTDAALNLNLSADLRDFMGSRGARGAYAILNEEGHVVAGEEWLRDYPPDTHEPEFSSQELRGVVYRIVTQRVNTSMGEFTVRLADGASPTWQRLRRLWIKVLLPNVLLAVLAYAAVQWAVRRALRPLLAVKEAVQGRSPRDLSALALDAIPEEVQPLVVALNHLFGLVNDQAESQRRFVADAAHQLRTPLAALQAQVEALAALPAAARGEPLQRLRDATRRTSQLVQQLLTLSRVEAAGALVAPTATAELKTLCEDVLELHLEAATLRHIDFGLEVVPVSVRGDAWLLREMLSNLVDNAIRYSHSGGCVTVRCGFAEDRLGAWLVVEDDGPGVPASEWPNILRRFYRSAGSGGDGSGLGLAIADEIAHAHHSQLLLGTGPNGRGLSVRVPLQAVPESPKQGPTDHD